jgi:hypothetical protein
MPDETTPEAVADSIVARVEKLQRFKDWVHNYLDRHGVPHHPPGTHGAEGCRIGDRMDWLMAQRAELLETLKRAEQWLRRLEQEHPGCLNPGAIDRHITPAISGAEGAV